MVGRINDFVIGGYYDDYYCYQSVEARIAVARGGLMGNGPGNSTQRNFLPHPYSDFIYAIIIEEYGLGGWIFIMLLYAVVLFRVGVIGRKSMKGEHYNARGFPDIFPALLATGLGLTIILQAMVNMGVCVGALPVTGQTLPLISLGGTSLLFTSASFGIILSIAHSFSPEGLAEEEARMKAREERVFGNRKTKEPEEWEEEVVDELDNGELPQKEVLSKAGGRRRGRRRAEADDMQEEIDILDEKGLTEMEVQLENEGRKVLRELRRK